MSFRHRVRLLLFPLLVGSFAPSTSRAQCDAIEQCIPQPTCPYVSIGETSFRESPSKISGIVLRNPSHCEPPPGSGIPVDSFFDIDYGWDFSPAPGAPPVHRKGSTTGTIRMMMAPDGSIEIELLALELSSAVGDTIRPRESPTRPSHGRQVATPKPGGGYHIDSFFDVFFELSLDGGQTWSEAEQPTTLRLTQEQPTPAQVATWGTVKARYR